MSDIGDQIHNFCKELWPINRSLTGKGVRETLELIKNKLSGLVIHEVPSGTKVFDWEVPKEWVIHNAWIIDPDGNKICNFKDNNLHLVGYSTPVNKKLSLDELQKKIHSLPDQPSAIPYVTSYYNEDWGFCMTQNQRNSLQDGTYEIYIDSDLKDGSLSYGEVLIKGKSSKEIFLSTYICHPSMANNELSGPTVTTFLCKWLLSKKNLRHSYRIIFIPETIGSVTYLSKNIDYMKKNVVGGFNISCVGDDRSYSYLPSRNGNTLSDKAAKHTLSMIDANYKSYSWNDRGSDERQYCAPGVDLPIASMMRTKYGDYKEYHTSLDNLQDVVTPSGLLGGYMMLKLAIETIEVNCYPKSKILGEPQLGKRGLYPNTSTKESGKSVRLMMNLITWSDGSLSLIDIAEKCNEPVWNLVDILNDLKKHDLIDISYDV
jgi:aminopeptidase-like protein